jgi:FkbM family methyltransferase
MGLSGLTSRWIKALFGRSRNLARLASFLLSVGGEYPILVRRNRWLRALARNADRAQLLAYVQAQRGRPSVVLSRLGGEYGGYFVPDGGMDSTSVAYSFGVGEDISFEKELIHRYRCEVHAFDPTPRAIEYTTMAIEGLSGFHFHPYGIGEVDGLARFYAPRNLRHVSYSEPNIQGTSAHLDMEVRTLQTIQEELGHERIDLLKMNIEGSELSVFEDIAKRHLDIPIIVAKLEAPVTFSRYAQTLDRLHRLGYWPVKADGSGITLVCGNSGEDQV